MISEFSDTILEHSGVWGIDQSELTGMHRYSHTIAFDEIANCFELLLEPSLPIIRTDRMRGKRNEIGRDAKKQDVVFQIEPQDLCKTDEVVLDGCHQAFFGVGLQAKGPAAFAP